MGKKKDAALHGLSKKERKALEERAAKIAAELEERKAAKKAKKKGATLEQKIAEATSAYPDAGLDALPEPPAEVAQAIADAKAERKAKREAAAALEVRPVEDIDAEIKARLQAKREVAAALEARLQAKRGAPENLAEMQNDVAAERAERVTAAEVINLINLVQHVAPPVEPQPAPQPVEEVETERGREFVVGEAMHTPAPVEEFAKPSEAPRDDFETNGLGQYKVMRPSDGKLVGYTRVTTYISCLEDTSSLTKWKARIILEGVAAIEETGEATVTARVRDLVHNRDVAIAKARKADRKGKLQTGELATYVEGAWSTFKRELNKLADEVFEVGGGREAATKGTDIHALCDLHDREGITAVCDLLTDGKITPADLADVEAYADAIRRLGAKIIETERVVVNDELKVAGRLDRVVMVKLPGEQRARRRVLDIKTGRVDYGAGKIAQQLEMYAGATGYNLDTHEREDLKLDRTKGILLHLPAGTGKATAHVADLTLGRKGNALAAQVRAWRNEGKRAIDLKVNLLDQIEGEA